MTSSCYALTCLSLGLAGLIGLSIGFALPYWFQEAGANGSSHGLWEKKECQSGNCRQTRIAFGITAAFESCRVFGSATIVIAFIAFVFNVILLNKPTKAWAIRTCSMWTCAALFNMLVVVLFGVTEKQTLQELGLDGVDTSKDIATRLEWGYWMAVASFATFVLLAVSCAALACTTKEKSKDAPETSRDGLQDNSHRYKTTFNTGDGLSFTTTKTADAFPPSVPRPAIYTTTANAGLSSNSAGYIIQPSPAAVNIDHRKVRLNALESPHYISAAMQERQRVSSASGRYVLNHPVFPPGASAGSVPVNEVTVPSQERANAVYVSRDGYSAHAAVAANPVVVQQYRNGNRPGVVVLSRDDGPPGYTTLPREPSQAVSVVPVSGQSNHITLNSNNQLYPKLY